MSENRLQALPKQDKLIVRDEGPMSYLWDTARFEHLYRVARMMSSSALLPKHLRGANTEEAAANCFRVVNQAMRWGFDPFAVADESYVVSGRLGWQGKLVAAVVNARAGLQGRLTPTYSGEGDGRTVKISGTFEGEDSPREITVSVKQVKTDNSMWTKQPDQKLFYTGATMWARRWCPEVLMGVLTVDDLEMMKQQGDLVEAEFTPVKQANEKLNGHAKQPEVKTETPPKPAEKPKEPTPTDETASEETHAAVVAEITRVGLSEKQVVELAKQVGAKRIGRLTATQAQRILDDLRELPDAREPGADDD